MDELKKKDSSQDCTKTAVVLSCLDAYYSLTALYYIWWDFGSTNLNLEGPNKKETTLSGCGSSDTKSSDAVSSLQKHTSQSISQSQNIGESNSRTDKADFVKGTDSVRTNGKGSTTTQQELLCANDRTHEVLSLSAKLRLISKALLSESHAKHAELKYKLARIQQAVGRLVAKHSAHVSPQNTEEKAGASAEEEARDTAKISASSAMPTDAQTESDSGCHSGTAASSEHQSNPESESRQSQNSSNCDTRSPNTHDAGASKDKADSSSISQDPELIEDPLPDSLLELTAALNSVLKEIESIPPDVKVSLQDLLAFMIFDCVLMHTLSFKMGLVQFFLVQFLTDMKDQHSINLDFKVLDISLSFFKFETLSKHASIKNVLYLTPSIQYIHLV